MEAFQSRHAIISLREKQRRAAAVQGRKSQCARGAKPHFHLKEGENQNHRYKRSIPLFLQLDGFIPQPQERLLGAASCFTYANGRFGLVATFHHVCVQHLQMPHHGDWTSIVRRNYFADSSNSYEDLKNLSFAERTFMTEHNFTTATNIYLSPISSRPRHFAHVPGRTIYGAHGGDSE